MEENESKIACSPTINHQTDPDIDPPVQQQLLSGPKYDLEHLDEFKMISSIKDNRPETSSSQIYAQDSVSLHGRKSDLAMAKKSG